MLQMRAFLIKVRLVCLLLGVVLIRPVPSSPLAVILFNPRSWGQGQVPAGWHLKVNHGKADLAISSDGAGSSIHLKSVDSSFGLERAADVNPSETRYLTWSWKVTELLAGRDFLDGATDDQARQIFANAGEQLFALSKCPDYIVNRGHYFGTQLSDADKQALIAFLKTF